MFRASAEIWWVLEAISSPWMYWCPGIASNCAYLAPAACVWAPFWSFQLRLKPWSHMPSSRNLVSYTNIRHWQFITYIENFLIVRIYIGLSSEMCFETLLKKHFSLLYQKLVLLLVDWSENCLLIAKRLRMMNKLTGYSYSSIIMKSIETNSKH